MRHTECSAVRKVVVTMTTSCIQPVLPSLQGARPSQGSWSRCIAASWMKRIGSSQPSIMTLGPGPGLSLLYLTLLPASALPFRIPVLICLSFQGQQSQDSAGAPAEASASDRTLPASRKPQDHAPGHKPVRGLPRWDLHWFSPCCLSRTTSAINSFSDSCPIRFFRSRISSPLPS